MKAIKVARFGLLTAVALILGWLEQMVPIAATLPGIKLGLANTVLLYAIYLMDTKSAALLMVLKVLLSGFLFAGLSAMLYSLRAAS
jgi:heptaprenyl diphosphate synthase